MKNVFKISSVPPCLRERKKLTFALSFFILHSSFFLFPASADTFLWNQANARMGTASAPQEFAEAAALYRSVIERGTPTAPAYYNYGTALLLADAPAAAIDALLRAERLGGTTPDLQRNLDLAIAKQLQAKHEVESTESFLWLRKPLFWHYALSLNTRALIAAFAFNLCFLVLLARIGNRKKHSSFFIFHSSFLMILAALAFALFATSALVSWHQNSKPLPEPVYAWETMRNEE